MKRVLEGLDGTLVDDEVANGEKVWLRLAAGALLTWSVSGCADAYGDKVMSSSEAIRQDKEKDASIRAEANAPGIPQEDEKRLLAVMTQRNANQEHEDASYARFQFEQRLELAEASAPKVTMYGFSDGGLGTNSSAVMEHHRGGNGYRTLLERGNGGDQASDWIGGDSAHRGEIPQNRFYYRSILDESADKLSRDAANRQLEAAQNQPPYGEPVAGSPGYVTSPGKPSSGYIDVRGYNPGTQVIDPYSGQPMRVP